MRVRAHGCQPAKAEMEEDARIDATPEAARAALMRTVENRGNGRRLTSVNVTYGYSSQEFSEVTTPGDPLGATMVGKSRCDARRGELR